VDPLGEAFGPSVLPDGLWVLFGEVTAAPVPAPPLIPVVALFVVPIEVPVEVPVELAPVEEIPLDDAPLACASAKELESANTVANIIVLSFMVVPLLGEQNKSPCKPKVPALRSTQGVHLAKGQKRPAIDFDHVPGARPADRRLSAPAGQTRCACADRPKALTLGTANACGADDFVSELGPIKLMAHAQHINGRRSALIGKMIRHGGYAVSQRIHKQIMRLKRPGLRQTTKLKISLN
jgi:hypothetical protein